MKLRADFEDGTSIEMECPMTEGVATMEAFREKVRTHLFPALGPVKLAISGVRDWFDDAGDYKIDVIRVVRSVLDIGLREAKDFVEAAQSIGVPSDHLTMEKLNAALGARGLVSRFRVAS